ncbi:hypothetical protein FBZ84_14020 [Azospirillum baldaniorum]|uniref:hypothetical protein n=1 Tax=Azospirillum baldaniorum TaxID=1064539 RepID=UPI0011A1DC6F|nr:hypothetical protein [Azospirillum baldaniorum]TWA52125.1 hypothetical protein FBZ84_14020 [Azospirillum baldaniorum]
MENRLTTDTQAALDARTAALLLAATKRTDLQGRVIGHLGYQGILDLLASDSLQHGIGDLLVEAFLDRLEGASPTAVQAVPATVPEDAEEVEEAVLTPPAPMAPQTSQSSSMPKAPEPSAHYDATAAANRIEQAVGPRPQATGARREWSRRLEQEIADELRKLRAVYGPDPRSTDARFRHLCVSIESRTRGKIDRAAVKIMADAPLVMASP